MRRAQRMCEACPFRLRIAPAERQDLAALSPEEFPCHTEAGYTTTDVQCRGHWQVRRKFAPAAKAHGGTPESVTVCVA
jgi:hypothetical protein